MANRREGYTKKKSGLPRKKFHTDVPISTMIRLDVIAENEELSKTQTLEKLIRDAYSIFKSTEENHLTIGAQNAEQNDFVNRYIEENFGLHPEDPELAQSEALKAYHEKKGYKFGSDEDSFIIPNFN